MAQQGGYRQPANPAPVSGMGSRSARTDGGVMDPDAPEYGEGVEIQNLTQAAPLTGQGGGVAAPQGGQMPSFVGLGAPSQDSRPVTTGAAAGAGSGPEALGLPMSPGQERQADARALSPSMVQALLAAATRSDATPSFKRLVRQVVAYR